MLYNTQVGGRYYTYVSLVFSKVLVLSENPPNYATMFLGVARHHGPGFEHSGGVDTSIRPDVGARGSPGREVQCDFGHVDVLPSRLRHRGPNEGTLSNMEPSSNKVCAHDLR